MWKVANHLVRVVDFPRLLRLCTGGVSFWWWVGGVGVIDGEVVVVRLIVLFIGY